MLKFLRAIKNIGFVSILIIAVLLITVLFAFWVIQTPKKIYAFPSAEGFGAFATGGRGGVVYHVRTLEDTGELGSLRYAVNQKGARTIVFDVTGNIELKSPLTISEGNLTIAGQTAPGEGICIKNYPVTINADNVIVRYVRFRAGDAFQGSSLVAKNRHDIIIDHCSISWATDSNVVLYNNSLLTMQWCIISEALNKSKGVGATLGGYTSSYHHNLFVSNSTAGPSFFKSSFDNELSMGIIDFRNNVLYNWQTSSADVQGSETYNLVNNYYKYGPATNIPSKSQIIETVPSDKTEKIYVHGNYVYSNPLNTNDNWMGVYPNTEYIKTSKNKLLTRFEFDHDPVTTHRAAQAYKAILEYAGASYNRDFTDNRISQSVETYVSGTSNSNGIIYSTEDAGGYPKYKKAAPLVDSDNDGIPDEWEYKHNLNPYDAGDGKSVTKSGYTYLEVYLNEIVNDITSKQNLYFLPTIDRLKMLVQVTANKLKKI